MLSKKDNSQALNSSGTDLSTIQCILNGKDAVKKIYNNEGKIVKYVLNENLKNWENWNTGKNNKLTEDDRKLVNSYLQSMTAMVVFLETAIETLNKKYGEKNNKSAQLAHVASYIHDSLKPLPESFCSPLHRIDHLVCIIHSICAVKEITMVSLDGKDDLLNSFKEMCAHNNFVYPDGAIFDSRNLYVNLVQNPNLGLLIELLKGNKFLYSLAKATGAYKGAPIDVSTTLLPDSKDQQPLPVITEVPNPEIDQKVIEPKKQSNVSDELLLMRKEFDELLSQLEKIHKNLNRKEKNNPGQYNDVINANNNLKSSLENAANKFFAQPITKQTFGTFQSDCRLALEDAEKSFKEHRGIWYQIPSVIRGVLGVLAALTVLPALIVEYKSKHGYVQTFFSNPPTASAEELNEFKEQEQALEEKFAPKQ